MRSLRSALGTMLVLAVVAAGAQTAPDPSGHWEGTITAPQFGEVRLEIDLMRSANGSLSGTVTLPVRKLKSFPLSTVALEGRLIKFEVAASANARFEADLSGDGKSMSGTFNGQMGPVPFAMTRTGDARVEPAPKSARIGKELEGTWTGALEAEGRTLRVVLKMSNDADGTSTGHMISVDEGGLDVPIAIVQNGLTLALELPMVGSSYSGTLNAAGTELVGTYK